MQKQVVQMMKSENTKNNINSNFFKKKLTVKAKHPCKCLSGFY